MRQTVLRVVFLILLLVVLQLTSLNVVDTPLRQNRLDHTTHFIGSKNGADFCGGILTDDDIFQLPYRYQSKFWKTFFFKLLPITSPGSYPNSFQKLGIAPDERTCTMGYGLLRSTFSRSMGGYPSQLNLKYEHYAKAPVRVSYDIIATLPQGVQDSGGGIVHDRLVTFGGFCGGNHEFRAHYCCGERGFNADSFALELRGKANGNVPVTVDHVWDKPLPGFPGGARQGHKCANVGKDSGALYCWGGFSYTPLASNASMEMLKQKKSNAYARKDGYRLQRDKKTGLFEWSKLPDLPVNQGVYMGIVSCGNGKVYIVGGADYDSELFHTDHDNKHENKGLGTFSWEYDPKRESWARLPNLPGNARMNGALACVDNVLYLFGGITSGTSIGSTNTFKSVLDNWSYSIENGKWSRLPDTPFVTSNWGSAPVFQKRYVVLLGGYGYSTSITVHGASPTVRKDVPKEYPYLGEKVNQYDYSNGVLVYDIMKRAFFWTDPLPINLNPSMIIGSNDSIYIVGGETGVGCFQPDTSYPGVPVGRHSEYIIRARVRNV